jgi:hypothetical protein
MLFGKYKLNDKAKENKMGRTCSTNEEGKECIKDTGWKAVSKDISRTIKT